MQAMAMEQIDGALAAGIPIGVLLADAACGTETGWREGSAAKLSSRFAAVRVRAAHNRQPHDEQWMLIEWPRGDSEPRHYWFSTLQANTPVKTLVATAQGRWRIERDYQELKSELGLHHYEGRNWRGFHHHASLCIAAYGFLMRA